tara:strand:+ start:43300 stop:43764 length:465 start_codon:yes stop_codon:yes gene_type:complete
MDLLSQVDSPIYLLSINEAEALLFIISDSSGMPMTIKQGTNYASMSCGTTSFYITPKHGSIKGDWSEDTCTDYIVIYTIVNSKRIAKIEFRLDSGITLKSLISEILQTVIKPIGKKANQESSSFTNFRPTERIGKASKKLTLIFQNLFNPLNIA